jgi:carbon-monoxide dehydrogenase medium subunit
LRNGNAVAVAAVAASLTLGSNDTISNARLVLGAVAPVPKLIESTATNLVGLSPDQEVFSRAAEAAMNAAEPISDVRGSADYRRKIVGVLTHQALTMAHERAKETVA